MAHSGGAKLGNKLAALISQTLVVTHAKLVHIKHKLAMKVFHDISDVISEEVHRSLDQVFGNIHDALPEGSHAKPLLKFMAQETGQAQAWAGVQTMAGSILSSVSQVLNNELADSVYGLLESNPHLLPDPGTLAGMAAHGIVDPSNAAQHIAMQGINTSWIGPLIESMKAYPDPNTALDFVRRQVITWAQFDEWAQRNGYTPDAVTAFKATVDSPISPADAALAVLRGNMPLEVAYAVARENGVLPGDFDILVSNTGEPPGPDQLLEANRRGFIDQARLAKGITQSRIRNEWLDVMEKLAFSPITTADAVNAVVQSHLTQAQGEAIATQNGLEPGNFTTLVETAGSPLSRTEMEQLYNRGLVTEAQVLQALNESRLKPKYNQLAFALHERLLEPRELADMVMWGSMTHADAVAQAMEQGYSAASASALINSAVNRKLQSDRNTVVSAIEQLYEDNAIAETDASEQIGRLGFSPPEVAFKLQAAELRRHTKLVNTGLTAIRSKFIGHHVDKNQASSLIDGMGIPHQQRDNLLQLWQIERDANVAQLTEAQIIKALKDGTFTVDQAMTRLMAKGYTQDDAAVLVEDM